ncbi:radical SAM protein [Thermodesulfatator atlanticus]
MWPRLYPHPENLPRLLFADRDGRIYDHPYLLAMGLSGYDVVLPQEEDFIPLPIGSALYVLPDRHPVGFDPEREVPVVLRENPFAPQEPAFAVAGYLAPAHTQLYLAPYVEARPDLPPLPLFSYASVGWHKGRFWAAAFRSDFDHRQEVRFFDEARIARAAQEMLKRFAENRFVRHLVENCVKRYRCPAARNFVLKRFEAPAPCSPSCNARCLGCLSAQPQDGPHIAQERIAFVPKAEEIAEALVPHLKGAKRAMVSFGQGCEGEPLLQAKLIEKAIKLLRAGTSRGTINLNTNASLPEEIGRLRRAGLDSIRVSLSSARDFYYHAYFNPRGYTFSQVKESIKQMKKMGGFVSLNLFVFPGLTDEQDEFEALCEVVSLGVDFIQLRNHAIDPIWYLKKIGFKSTGKCLGIKNLVKKLSRAFPRLCFGYFNPPLR